MNALTKMLPLPSIVNHSYDREATNARLGVTLPDDYWLFLKCYGGGVIDGFLNLLVPGAANPNVDLLAQLDQQSEAIRVILADQGYKHIYCPFPEPGGVIPWAISDNGDVCFWKTGARDSNAWPVVVCDGKMWRWHAYDCGMMGFLVNVLSRSLADTVFPSDFPSAQPSFVGYGPEVGSPYR